MHYIIGTTFKTPDTTRSKPIGPVTSKTFKRKTSNMLSRHLKPGAIYSVYHISPQGDEGVLYVFKEIETSKTISMTFKTVSEADKAISQLREEDLPDYYANDTRSD